MPWGDWPLSLWRFYVKLSLLHSPLFVMIKPFHVLRQIGFVLISSYTLCHSACPSGMCFPRPSCALSVRGGLGNNKPNLAKTYLCQASHYRKWLGALCCQRRLFVRAWGTSVSASEVIGLMAWPVGTYMISVCDSTLIWIDRLNMFVFN